MATDEQIDAAVAQVQWLFPKEATYANVRSICAQAIEAAERVRRYSAIAEKLVSSEPERAAKAFELTAEEENAFVEANASAHPESLNGRLAGAVSRALSTLGPTERERELSGKLETVKRLLRERDDEIERLREAISRQNTLHHDSEDPIDKVLRELEVAIGAQSIESRDAYVWSRFKTARDEQRAKIELLTERERELERELLLVAEACGLVNRVDGRHGYERGTGERIAASIKNAERLATEDEAEIIALRARVAAFETSHPSEPLSEDEEQNLDRLERELDRIGDCLYVYVHNVRPVVAMLKARLPKPALVDPLEAATAFILNQVAGMAIYDAVKERLASLADALRAQKEAAGG